MFIPPNNIKAQLVKKEESGGPIRLKSSHLLFSQEIVDQVFGEQTSAYMIYYPDRRTLMVAPASDELFKQLHKVTQHIIKDRNMKGDKAIALHEILIDHQLEAVDRDLSFEWQEEMGILNITL